LATDASPATTLRSHAEALSAPLPPLLVAAERVAATVAQGVHGRRRTGQGEAFWQFRRYETGDAVQRIDWRQSAKTRHLFVRETEWEAAQSVWLWADNSPSMDYASGPALERKVDRARLLALALMALLVRGGERIALLGDGGSPATGRATLNRLATVLLDAGEAGPGLPAEMPLPRHANTVLIGDLLAPLDVVDRLVRSFAARGVHGHLLQVLDPAEATLPFQGRSRFAGLEAEGNLLVGKAEGLRDAYVERLVAHQEGLMAIARAVGWSFAVHHTDRPPQPALLALYTAMADAMEA